MKRINDLIDKNIIRIILVYLFMQPVIDVITAFCLNIFNTSFTFGIVIRILFLGFIGYYFLFINKSQEKKKTRIYLGIIGVYLISFCILTLSIKGTSAFLYEIQNTIRTFYFPIMLLLLFNIFTYKKEVIDTKNYVRIMFIYLIFILIPNLFNIGFNSYNEAKVGSIGWFNSGNEINGILSLLLPFCFSWLVSFKKNRKDIISRVIYGLILLYVFFSIGTKMAIISLVFVGGIFLLKKVITLFREKKYKILSLLGGGLVIICGILILVVPKTSFYKNIMIHLNYLGVTNITEVITNPKVLDHFVFSSRLTFLSKTNDNYMKSSITEKVIGIGYIENYGTDEVRIKNIEMDPCDIFYRHGIIGFIIYFIPVIYLGYITLVETKKDKGNIKNENFYLSLILIIFMSIFTGHIITAPAVSIFVIVIIINQYIEIISRNTREKGYKK